MLKHIQARHDPPCKKERPNFETEKQLFTNHRVQRFWKLLDLNFKIAYFAPIEKLKNSRS